jgi:hypothetical protein
MYVILQALGWLIALAKSILQYYRQDLVRKHQNHHGG